MLHLNAGNRLFKAISLFLFRIVMYQESLIKNAQNRRKIVLKQERFLPYDARLSFKFLDWFSYLHDVSILKRHLFCFLGGGQLKT